LYEILLKKWKEPKLKPKEEVEKQGIENESFEGFDEVPL